MAQSGYTPILTYASGTATNVPLAANLTSSASGAELALNYADGKLYYKDSGGVVQVLASKAGNVNVSSFSAGTTGFTPSTATTGAVTLAGTLGIANGGTNGTSAGIGLFNNITGYTASGATGTTSTNLVFSTSPTITTPNIALVYGGSAASSTLTLQSTSGVGTTDSIVAKVGNAGAITAFTIATTGILTFNTTGAVTLPVGTTGQQPTPTAGMLRFNSTTSQFEGYNGAAWASVGGAAISNDTATSTNIYPISASATSGTALTVYTSNAKFLYKPSTGELQASEIVASNGLFVNATSIAASYTIASGYNAQSVGPVTIASGQSVTVTSGQRWLVF
jgi:hypothetical protein